MLIYFICFVLFGFLSACVSWDLLLCRPASRKSWKVQFIARRLTRNKNLFKSCEVSVLRKDITFLSGRRRINLTFRSTQWHFAWNCGSEWKSGTFASRKSKRVDWWTLISVIAISFTVTPCKRKQRQIADFLRCYKLSASELTGWMLWRHRVETND